MADHKHESTCCCEQANSQQIAEEANATVPATTHALFHTMADMASIRGNYIDTGVSLVNAGYDRTRPRRYLNDHNEAVPFRKTGLAGEDMEVFRKFGIEP